VQYLGGKKRLGKRLIQVLAPEIERRGGVVFEPFCGGLGMSRYFAPYQGALADVHPALMALYTAVREGWTPPAFVSREEYRAARALPDSDPLKAFAGFACSFGAKYFGGYSMEHFTRRGEDPIGATARDLLDVVPKLQRFELRCASFLDAPPSPDYGVVYCDPPYEGTTQYSGAARLDRERFWAHCQQWARVSSVFVSEYQCPVPHKVVFEHAHLTTVGPARRNEARVERLFRVSPT
jgi:DNA adenine methylase